MVLNKDPSNTVQAQFTVNGFTPKQVTSYTLSAKSPTKIVASTTTALVCDDELRALHARRCWW